MTLDELALKHGTDKASNLHNYTRWYERHLPHRDAEIDLLEIGVSKGASLRMWRDYYLDAKITGIDIVDCDKIDGVTIIKCDQRTSNLSGRFDVIIDDGSHRWDDQQASFKSFWPAVKPGGVYVIEDLHSSYFMSFGSAGEQPTIPFLHRIMDDVNLHGHGGLGDIRNHEDYEKLKEHLSIYQRTVESMIFYKSIVFIRKNDNQC